MWEERFAQEGYLFGTEPVPFLLKHDTFFSRGQSVLSIAEPHRPAPQTFRMSRRHCPICTGRKVHNRCRRTSAHCARDELSRGSPGRARQAGRTAHLPCSRMLDGGRRRHQPQDSLRRRHLLVLEHVRVWPAIEGFCGRLHIEPASLPISSQAWPSPVHDAGYIRAGSPFSLRSCRPDNCSMRLHAKAASRSASSPHSRPVHRKPYIAVCTVFCRQK